MRSLSRRRPVAAFILFAIAVTGVVFGLPLLSVNGIGLIPVELPAMEPFVLVEAVALVLIALMVTRMADDSPGVREFRGRIFRFRVNPLWYLFALLALPTTALVTAIVVSGPGAVAELWAQPELLLAILVNAIGAFVLVNWWEEAAFTGFVLHRLQPRFGPVRASVLTTWAQALVHVPLVFVADGVTTGRVAAADVPVYLVALFLLPIPVRIVITWLYNVARQSIPVVGLFHAGLGVATGTAFIPEIAPDFNQFWVYAGFAAVAAVVLTVTKGRLGYEAPASESWGVSHPLQRGDLSESPS
ncbi:MAG TPA: CPBP family glutamic-type intramembrane protease [Acidimicrobiia bacterium]|nr:CPBP family glutamic-type intramembrane protease [Acidimicrobiia bacterium]